MPASPNKPLYVVVGPPAYARCGVNYSTEIPCLSTVVTEFLQTDVGNVVAGTTDAWVRWSSGAQRPSVRSRRLPRNPLSPRRSAGTTPGRACGDGRARQVRGTRSPPGI